MSQQDTQIQSAIADLAVIRRALESVDGGAKDPQSPQMTLRRKAQLILQGAGLFGASLLLASEFFSTTSVTEVVVATRVMTELQNYSIAFMATLLTTLVGIAYFVMWRASRFAGTPFSEYVARHFSYLRNLSLVADLMVKFASLTLIVQAGHQEWVAPLLLLFTGDFLIQGRFFTLPLRISLAVGAATIGGAALQYFKGSPSLVWPLAVFCIITACSIIYSTKA